MGAMKRKPVMDSVEETGGTRVKAEEAIRVRLYEDTDAKVKRRAQRKGVPPAQILNDIVEEYYRTEDLLPSNSERKEETVAEFHKLGQTVQQLSDGLHSQRLLVESYHVAINDELGSQSSTLYVSKLLNNAQYKLLGLILELQLLTQQLLVQYVVDPHLKGLGAQTDIHHLLASAHAPNNHLSDRTKAVLRVAGTAAQQERIKTCRALLEGSVTAEKGLQTSYVTAESRAPIAQSPDLATAAAPATEEAREKES